ncbi:MAG: IMP dehydrogenase, partial [bacterium]
MKTHPDLSNRLQAPVDEPRLGLTFDDVLLVPQRSDVQRRADVDTRTRLTTGIEMAIPVLSANMDAVTEGEMAIGMAREGGIDVIHRFLSVEQQVAQVRRVKRAESIVIEEPYTVDPARPIREAIAFMDEHGSAGLLVLDGDGRLLGMVTARDLLFADDVNKPVAEVMTPRERLVTAPPGVGLEEARAILHKHRIEKLPLVDAQGALRGLITSRDIRSRLKHPEATKDARGRLRVGAAVGIRGDYLERAQALVAEGVDALV